jgi:hypothetical protein
MILFPAWAGSSRLRWPENSLKTKAFNASSGKKGDFSKKSGKIRVPEVEIRDIWVVLSSARWEWEVEKT